YLYYYYSAAEAVSNLIRAGRTRGEQLLGLNTRLFADLERARAEEDWEAMQCIFAAYHRQRGETYFVSETGGRGAHGLSALAQAELEAPAAEGYAGVALNVMAALAGNEPKVLILNVPNRGAIGGMRNDDVVETGCWVGPGLIRPLAAGAVPDHALGLMK